jgi:hypothetical protein
MNTINKIMIVAVLCALSFWLGRFSLSRQVVVYQSLFGNTEAFPRNDPGYGLDLSLHAAILSELRSTNSPKGLSDLEASLDLDVERAEHRRPLLSEWGLEQLDSGLGWAARYREEHPRPLSQGTGFYLTADKQTEIDMFLKGFTNSIRRQPNNSLEPTATAPSVSTNK